jgi:hypothetical protein
MHVQSVAAENLRPIVNQMVDESAHVMTDSSTVLAGALMTRTHDQEPQRQRVCPVRGCGVHQHEQNRRLLFHPEAWYKRRLSPCWKAAPSPLSE